MPEGTLTAAHGVYDVDARTFTADRVLAGSSVPGVEFDTVIGTVIARNLNQLVVRGGTVVRTDGSVVYARGDIEVTLDSGTDVTKDDGSTTPLNIDDISVGQRIHAFGEASTSDFNPTLDATGGRVRHAPDAPDRRRGERQLGRAAPRPLLDRRPRPAVLRLRRHGHLVSSPRRTRRTTRSAPAISTWVTSTTAKAWRRSASSRLSAPRHRISSHGRSSHFDELRALLGIGWGFAGTEAPFLSMGQNGFVIDVRNIDLGERQRLEIGPFVFDITSDLPEPISIEPPAEGPQIYTVARGLRVEHFSDFGDFASRVNSLLRGGSNMRALTARGAFDIDTTTLEANYVAVSFPAQ